ncbi:hypothetical protein TIFTF001_012140 [Ficus carica]|uniref:Fungal lipase-type domain-containing protein n=1 Tax=Ficus carica TaxID=3494 RepID=A0AA88AMV9_FICCA|nr:hypothetical protein TIFTF001_012140 [Ficus carica]
MACASLSIPASPVASNCLCRSESSKDLQKRATIQRSYSDNHLVRRFNRIHATSTQPKLKNSRSMGLFPFQFSAGSILPSSLRSFSKGLSIVEKETSNADQEIMENVEDNTEGQEIKRANWVERLLELRTHWRNRKQQQDSFDEIEVCDEEEEFGDCSCDGEEGCCEVSYSSDEEGGGEKRVDRESFSRFLAKVPLSDTKLFSQLAFLCNMAYVIQDIRHTDLTRYFGLKFVTSSLEKKAEAAAIKARLDQDSTQVPVDSMEEKESIGSTSGDEVVDSGKKRPIRASMAYEIAASAASYVQSKAKNMFSSASELEPEDSGENGEGEDEEEEEEEGESSPRVYKSEVAAYMAASTMTAVVAACEKEKSEAAKDLQSLHSSPCEWFVCDDSNTRCFVIQGSDSLASWQANLFFEPTKFEKTECLVHRGIYEAAKGIYTQLMPEIIEHLNKYGERAKLQFTGHSLGGSLSLLVHLMLLTRKIVKPSALRPVVTFGSPFVFCGGQKILDELGLDESQFHCVMMHRDIVPRAFSCNYPNHVANLLKRLNGTFRSHPCLIKNKLLYTPMGKLFFLQPDEASSPPHPLLPPGSALYALDKTRRGYSTSLLRAFLNSPHPIETLSDPTAYGSEGTILRDHDSSNYLKAVNGVLRQDKKKAKNAQKVRKEWNVLWPLLTSPSPHSWCYENNMEKNNRLKKEIMTGV